MTPSASPRRGEGTADELLVARVRPLALRLVGIVRDEGQDAVAGVLHPLDLRELYALAVVLAAMVPDDRPLSDLLGWTA